MVSRCGEKRAKGAVYDDVSGMTNLVANVVYVMPMFRVPMRADASQRHCLDSGKNTKLFRADEPEVAQVVFSMPGIEGDHSIERHVLARFRVNVLPP